MQLVNYFSIRRSSAKSKISQALFQDRLVVTWSSKTEQEMQVLMDNHSIHQIL